MCQIVIAVCGGGFEPAHEQGQGTLWALKRAASLGKKIKIVQLKDSTQAETGRMQAIIAEASSIASPAAPQQVTWLSWESPLCGALASDCARALDKEVPMSLSGQTRISTSAKRATVRIALVQWHNVIRFGSGVIVSPSGMIVTAAHNVAMQSGNTQGSAVMYSTDILNKMITGDTGDGVPQILIGVLEDDEKSTRWKYRARLLTPVEVLIKRHEERPIT